MLSPSSGCLTGYLVLFSTLEMRMVSVNIKGIIRTEPCGCIEICSFRVLFMWFNFTKMKAKHVWDLSVTILFALLVLICSDQFDNVWTWGRAWICLNWWLVSVFASSDVNFRVFGSILSYFKISIILLTCLLLFETSIHDSADMEHTTLIQNELSLRTVKIYGESLRKLQQHELPGRFWGRIILREQAEHSSLAKLDSLTQSLSLVLVDGSTRISLQPPVL